MKYEIKGTPLPVVILSLESGEKIKTDQGAMSWMSPNMQMSTNAGGGIGKARPCEESDDRIPNEERGGYRRVWKKLGRGA